jgi:hypothetical protein
MMQPRLDTTSRIVNLVPTKVTRRVGARPRRGFRRAIGPASKECLEARPGPVWDTGQQARAFEIVGFMAPIVVVRRRRDGQKGSLMFRHQPRFDFGLEPYRPRHHRDGRARTPARIDRRSIGY